MEPWKRIFLFAVLAIAIFAGGIYGVPFVIDMATRGRRLSSRHVLGSNRNVPVPPAELAADAARVLGRPVSLEAYALAAMGRSEEPDEPPEVKALLMHVAMNDAAALGWSVPGVITYSTVGTRDGFFGEQTSRRYSSRLAPYEQDLAAAEAVIAYRTAGGTDPTGGAVKFFNRGKLLKADPPPGWASEGLRPRNVPPAPARLLFFVREGRRVA